MLAVKVFSVTKQRDRDELGERITRWLRADDVKVVDKVMLQSSDAEYHCLSCVIFYEVEGGSTPR